MDISQLLHFKAKNFQLGFLEPATSSMLGIIDLHHTIMFYLIIVFFLVLWLLFRLIFSGNTTLTLIINKALPLNYERDDHFHNCALLEILWTIMPSFVIFAIVFPSLSLLHSIDDFIDPLVTLKVIGNQWYWSYEYSDYVYTDIQNSLCYDSNMKDMDNTTKDILLVDEEVTLPSFISLRFLITSEDVLHSWAIPSLGIKMDAVPGRLNQVITTISKTGVYYGQCSELCGVGHGFMPINIRVLSSIDYLSWICDSYLTDCSISLPYSSNGILELLYIIKQQENKIKSIFDNKSFSIHTNKNLPYFLNSLSFRTNHRLFNVNNNKINSLLIKS